MSPSLHQMRTIIAVIVVVGVILFVIGIATDHWAGTQTSNWGLWSYCSNKTTTVHHSSNSSMSTTTTAYPSSEEHDDDDDEEDDDSVDEDNCDAFSLDDLSGTYHFMRFLAIVSLVALGYSVFGGGMVSREVSDDSHFIFKYKGELTCIAGAATGILIVMLYESTYKNLTFGGHGKVTLSYSLDLTFAGSIILLIAATLKLLPLIKRGLKSLERLFLSKTVRRSESTPEVEPDTLQRGTRARVSVASLNTSMTDNTNPDWRPTTLSDDMVNVEIDLNPPSPTSSRYSIASSHTDLPANRSSSYNDPAPRYEDLSPREDVPPPPSYEDAVIGLYPVSDPSSNASPNHSVIPSAPPLSTDNTKPPPPPYNESVA